MITLEPSREIGTDGDLAAPGVEAGFWREMGLSRSGLSRFLRKGQKLVGLEGEVEVLLAGDRTLRQLNRTYRGKNKATDVLSFPAAQEFAAGHAGDLAISLETAARQAQEHGHTLRDEVRVLLLHGLLHLAGMDHEVDSGEMAAKEASLRKELRLPGGLIERVESGAGRKSGGGAKTISSKAVTRKTAKLKVTEKVILAGVVRTGRQRKRVKA